MTKRFLFVLTVAMYMTASVYATTEIVFWHAFEGFLFDKFREIVDEFNLQSDDYRIKLVYKGNYADTFKNGIAAFEEKSHPHILQVYEVGTHTMVERPDLFVSAEELMHAYTKDFRPGIYIDAVKSFYSSAEGKMHSLPWNASTGILFYNKHAFADAGLDPEIPPKTWEEVEMMSAKLAQAGYAGFTTAWPAAYHLEHLCSLHNLSFATKNNGFAGHDARLCFNGPWQVRHLQKLVDWQACGFFSYQGRYTNEPEQYFTEGRCGILMQGANRYAQIKKSAEFPIGVGFLPYWSDLVQAPYRLNIGGSSFWALSGFDNNAYKGVALFFNYLSQPEVQTSWHEQTGYLPITEAAYYQSKKEGFYEKNPGAEIALLEVLQREGTCNTKGIRLPHYQEVRELIIDHLEKAFNKELSPKDALDQAVEEGNKIL